MIGGIGCQIDRHGQAFSARGRHQRALLKVPRIISFGFDMPSELLNLYGDSKNWKCNDEEDNGGKRCFIKGNIWSRMQDNLKGSIFL